MWTLEMAPSRSCALPLLEPNMVRVVCCPKGFPREKKMRLSNRFLTGSAICLLMAAPSAFAETLDARSSAGTSAPVILAQADGGQAPAAECPPGTTASADGCVPAQGPAQPPAAP